MSERSRQQKTIGNDLDTIIEQELSRKATPAEASGLTEWHAQRDEWAKLNEVQTPSLKKEADIFTADELASARAELSHVEGINAIDDKTLITFLDQYTAGEVNSLKEMVSSRHEKSTATPEEIAAATAEFAVALEDGQVANPNKPKEKISVALRLGYHLNRAKEAIIGGTVRGALRAWNRIPFEKLPQSLQPAAKLGVVALGAVAGVYGPRYGAHELGSIFTPSLANASSTPPRGATSNPLLDPQPFFNNPFSPDATPPRGGGASSSTSHDLFKQAANEGHKGNRMITKGVTDELEDVKHGKLKGEDLKTFKEDMSTKTRHRGEYLANLREKMKIGNSADAYRAAIDSIHERTQDYLTSDGRHLSETGQRAYKHFSNFLEHARVEKVSPQEAMNRGFNVNAGIMEGDLKRGLDDKTVVGGSFDKDVYIITGKNAQGETIQLAVKEDCYNLLSKQPEVPNVSTGNESTDTGTEHTDTGSEHTDTGSEHTDTGNESTDTGDERTDTGKEHTDTGRESTDTGRESTDTGSESTDTGTEHTDTGSEHTDTGSEHTDTGNESTDTGDELTDKGPTQGTGDGTPGVEDPTGNGNTSPQASTGGEQVAPPTGPTPEQAPGAGNPTNPTPSPTETAPPDATTTPGAGSAGQNTGDPGAPK